MSKNNDDKALIQMAVVMGFAFLGFAMSSMAGFAESEATDSLQLVKDALFGGAVGTFIGIIFGIFMASGIK